MDHQAHSGICKMQMLPDMLERSIVKFSKVLDSFGKMNDR